MNRTEFIVATAMVLFAAFMLGWFAHWILHRFAGIDARDMTELDRLARELQEAEDAREEAVAQARAQAAEAGRRLSGANADLRATMDGLRAAREEAEALRLENARLRQM